MAVQEARMIGRETKMAEQVSERTAREIKMAVYIKRLQCLHRGLQ